MPEEKARRAAEALSTFEPIQSDLRVLNIKLNLVISALVLIGLPSLWLLLRIAAKIGALPI